MRNSNACIGKITQLTRTPEYLRPSPPISITSLMPPYIKLMLEKVISDGQASSADKIEAARLLLKYS
jgi:hypothetical protein